VVVVVVVVDQVGILRRRCTRFEKNYTAAIHLGR